ncbi:MAG: sigma 54-interacting transcriptional regulator [Gammaproteobacteria bacterium]|nr:sigma 54-interacting transcriptional regulator [Gammaproteobacteria bacterium]
MNKILISLVGSRLDAGGRGDRRWKRWRPNVGLAMQEALQFTQIELLYFDVNESLARDISADISEVSSATTVNLHKLVAEDQWDFQQVYLQLLDYAESQRFDEEHNEYFVHITTGTHVVQICLFLLNEANLLPGRLIQSSPASDRGPKGTYSVIDLDLASYDPIAQRFAKQREMAGQWLKGGIETRNHAFNRMIDEIERVAVRSTTPILLSGPTGAGKTQLAKRIYELKLDRRLVSGRLVSINCATLRGDTAMSTLFGHARGAFTGAGQARKGMLVEANGGVLFLDEVAELGLDEQAMLLKALEEKRFSPVGSDNEVESDFQLICGSNADLYRLAAEGRFRRDLLARIDIWRYRLPALKDRQEDFEPNLDFELDRAGSALGAKVSFNRSARDTYIAFARSAEAQWQGNFRDLNASVARMATLAIGGRITQDIVTVEIARLREDWKGSESSPVDILHRYLESDDIESMDLFDQMQLSQVIIACRQSKSAAEAGRKLFAQSIKQKQSKNDSHRLISYLAKFGLKFADLQ